MRRGGGGRLLEGEGASGAEGVERRGSSNVQLPRCRGHVHLHADTAFVEQMRSSYPSLPLPRLPPLNCSDQAFDGQ